MIRSCRNQWKHERKMRKNSSKETKLKQVKKHRHPVASSGPSCSRVCLMNDLKEEEEEETASKQIDFTRLSALSVSQDLKSSFTQLLCLCCEQMKYVHR